MPRNIEPEKLYIGYAGGKKATAPITGAKLLALAANPIYSRLDWMEKPGQSIPAGVEKAAKGKKKNLNLDDRDTQELGPADGLDSGGAGGPAE